MYNFFCTKRKSRFSKKKRSELWGVSKSKEMGQGGTNNGKIHLSAIAMWNCCGNESIGK